MAQNKAAQCTLGNWANVACVRLSLRGTSASPPARCIHRSLRDTSSAGYRLLVSLAAVGASRELSSRRSPAHPSSDRLRGSLRSGDTAPHTCAVSPTFRYGAFFFVASALAAVPPARLIACRNRASANWGSTTLAPACAARLSPRWIWRLAGAIGFSLRLRIALRYSASPLTTCKGLCATAQTESRTGFPQISGSSEVCEKIHWGFWPVYKPGTHCNLIS